VEEEYMPALLQSRITRRRFLESATLGALVLGVGGISARGADDAEKTFHIALLSDTHLPADKEEAFRGFKPWENFTKITPEVVEAKPELIILNGDGARLEGKVADYEALQMLLKPMLDVAPVCIGMGNHDDRANFLTVFKAVAGEKQKVPNKHVMVIEHDLMRIAVLDSLLYTNKVAGMLGKAQRTWLADWLPTVKDRPVIIFVHHSLGDQEGDIADVERLFALLEPHPHVKAIFYGHSHKWVLGERQGIKLINLPAVGYNFGDGEPVGWVDAKFRKNGVELTMHALGGNMADNGKKFELKWA
jgi:Icc protein